MPQAQTYQSEFTGLEMDARFTAVAQLTDALEALTAVVAQKYVKPASGIPSTDMDADVQAALAKANTAVQSLADYYTKSEVDQLLAAINGMEYVDVAALPTASASTMGKIYLVGPDGSGYYSYYYTSYDGSAYSWVGPLGTTQISLANYATKAELSQLDQKLDGFHLVLSETSGGSTWKYSDFFPLKGGIEYTFALTLGAPSGTSAVYLNLFDTNDTQAFTNNKSVASTSNSYSFTYTPAANVSVRLGIYSSNTRDITTTVTSGVYDSALLQNMNAIGQVTTFLQSRLGQNFIPAIEKTYINYDSATDKITIPRQVVILFNNSYLSPNSGTNVELSLASLSTSAVKIVYDTSDSSFKAIAYNTNNSATQITIAGIRKHNNTYPDSGAISSLFPWSWDGKPYKITVPEVINRGLTRGVNHRGWIDCPENTLPAYKESKRRGFVYVETDVEFTSDDVPVLLHDSTINRTARNADGSSLSETVNIADITYDEALEYDFGIYKGAAFAGTKIPTLEQFVQLCRNIGLYPHIEIKSGFTAAQHKKCFDIVAGYGMAKNVIWTSFDATALASIAALDEYARLCYIVYSINSTAITTAKGLRTGKNDVYIGTNTYTPAELELAMADNFPISVWTINSKATIQALPAMVSSVTSDNLDASVILYEDSLS